MNKTVLMSGADYFSVKELNPYSHEQNQPSIARAKAEHARVKAALETAGINIIQVPTPSGCQDGVYTANWALVIGKKAVLAKLPNARTAEEPYARSSLKQLELELVDPPHRFSGQGDSLLCGSYLFCGQGYRTDPRMHEFLAEQFPHLEVVSLRTIPLLDDQGKPVINKVSDWPDSYFYDLDLALSVLKEDLIAYCPAAFTLESREILNNLPIEKIEVSLDEAKNGFACNLVSTGETVIMSADAPKLKSVVEAHGLKTIALEAPELLKGGGFIRCTSLTLN